jgi:hypothetical protein
MVLSYEENQATNAWYAVDIGAAYVPGEPDSIVVSPLNVQIFTETNVDGCSEVNLQYCLIRLYSKRSGNNTTYF